MTSQTSEAVDRPTTPDHGSAALDLLVAHVPLSLLIDLMTPVNSRDIYASEPQVADWLPAAVG